MKRMLEKFRDVTARKPSGWLGKRMYVDPRAHRESFRIILEKLDLKNDDTYLEVACGGGVLFEMALRIVSRAAAIDHSADMVELTIERNKAAVQSGVAEVVEGNAESLPWPDESFSCAACANAFFFIEHPELLLSEISRVLEPKGRLVFTTFSGESSLIGLLFKRPYNLKTYPKEKMQLMLSSAGFSVVEADTISGIQVWMAQKA